ncbi:TIGR00341 family protein [Acetitomaculum ruminis DSM 5522]|uniref:TIGR00341 family protein n=1 Tax=Acetitomaculum ruminis DSM 5522 TaxID=1120918 RepID=A0A1I0V2L1_9FIRM|nr:TIGR00341 family protein [Acetitomaculum ruminis]SFA69786.1 TIGR00341 family protein [Acetitomaculum ruminis DSM 5522]
MNSFKKHSLNEAIKKMFSLSEDVASSEDIRERIVSAGKISGTNMVIMMCAMLIASVGLNTNSIPVVIGAMLISPLMGSILAIAYGTVSNNSFMIEKHLAGFIFQIIISVFTATIYFSLSPLKEVTEQLFARTSPSFYDVIIAIAGGIAGMVGQTRKDKANNIIPGVAIATALMPPLCTCGYAIANWKLKMLLGAFYLFTINAYFIYLSSCIVLDIIGTQRIRELSSKEKQERKRKMLRNTLIVLLPLILIAYSLVHH